MEVQLAFATTVCIRLGVRGVSNAPLLLAPCFSGYSDFQQYQLWETEFKSVTVHAGKIKPFIAKVTIEQPVAYGRTQS
jgi:hypothetical protein